MKNKFKFGTRVRHATEPDMRGMILSLSSDRKNVEVQWDGGVLQWVDLKDLKVAGYVL